MDPHFSGQKRDRLYSAGGGTPQQITSHNAQVTYPVLLDRRTLLYLATDADGSGPWLYGMNVERRIPHRLNSGPDMYTSLAVSGDSRRLVATLAAPKRTLWRLRISDSPATTPTRLPLTTGTGFSPRFGPDYLVYVSRSGSSDSIWKLSDGKSSELWNNKEARILGAPAVSSDGRKIAFSAEQHGRFLLYTIERDGTNAKVVADSLAIQGTPAWAPDARSITVAANEHGMPHLFQVPLDGRSPVALIRDYSLDPAWASDGRFVIYSGPDVGTRFAVKAVTPNGGSQPLPALTLTRGARHLVFEHGTNALVFLRGEIRHKDVWQVDINTGAERRLAQLDPEFDTADFDISPDGRELVLERVVEHSDIVLLDLPPR
jgi:dipeptidyl aminopeptidase/acylaminoacyl peptidase